MPDTVVVNAPSSQPLSTPEEVAVLDQAQIAALVERFYDRVRRDALIGPVFNAAIDDWDAHKRTLVSFWSTVALRSGTYRGNPMAAHRPHPIRAEHFDRWLELWRETTSSMLTPAHAALLCDHAVRIGRSLRHGLRVDVLPQLLAPR